MKDTCNEEIKMGFTRLKENKYMKNKPVTRCGHIHGNEICVT